MMLSRQKDIGQLWDTIQIGDSFQTELEIQDRDILLYLGMVDDPNPIYIQHNYAERTPYKKPIVPHVLLTGLIFSCINKHLPGPGAVIRASHLDFSDVLYHYAKILLKLEVVAKHHNQTITLKVDLVDRDNRPIVHGTLDVATPQPKQMLQTEIFDNF